MRMRRLAATAACLGLPAAPATADAAETAVTSPNVTHVKNIPYAAANGTIPNFGTDIEFAKLGGRQYALAGSYRPNGGVWFYEVTGELERDPALVGYYNIDDVRPTTTPDGTCTAHVFDVHEREQVLTIAWYNGGTRVLDVSGLTGITIGGAQISGEGVKEIGSARFPGSDTWSAKTPTIDRRTGDFFLYANDMARGLDTWKFDGAGAKPAKKGRWMGGAEAQAYFAEHRVALPAGYALRCLLPA
jgi:hypothetical protein